MFGIDGPEFFVILLVLIIVVGPKDLPKMLRTIAKAMAYVRSTANEFRYQFDDAIRQAELDDFKKSLSDISDLNLSKELTETLNPIHDAVGDISNNFDIKITHHKLEEEKKTLKFDQHKINEDLTLSVEPHSSGSISVTSKDRKNVS